MKYTLSNVKSVKREGTSKSGNHYSIDVTELTVSIPVNKDDQFGHAPKTYAYGTAENIAKLEPLRGKLPCEVELKLADELDDYDNVKTVVQEVIHPALKAKVVSS